MTAKEFVNEKLGDKMYTHSPYPLFRNEIEGWLDEYWNWAIKAAAENAMIGTKTVFDETVYVIGKEEQINDIDIICVHKDSILNLIK